jgi:cytochrome b involved in lipid metabolism
MSATEEITYAEVSNHSSKKDLYVVIHDKVYNASTFVDEHPYVTTKSPPGSLSPIQYRCIS